MLRACKYIAVQDVSGLGWHRQNYELLGGRMIGIILTLLAVLLVICFAFYYSEQPPERGSRADTLFYLNSKSLRKEPDRTKRPRRRGAKPIANRQS
jgi:hypothetical protein